MSIEDVLAELKKNYTDALPARALLIEQLHAKRNYADVEVEFHKLKGTGKTYGLPEVSAVGEIAEKLSEVPSLADDAIKHALSVLRKISAARATGASLDLATDPDFLHLSELAKRL